MRPEGHFIQLLGLNQAYGTQILPLKQYACASDHPSTPSVPDTVSISDGLINPIPTFHWFEFRIFNTFVPPVPQFLSYILVTDKSARPQSSFPPDIMRISHEAQTGGKAPHEGIAAQVIVPLFAEVTASPVSQRLVPE